MARLDELYRRSYEHGVKLALDPRITGALVGGGLGAGAGALVDSDHRARGALIGGAGGALVGAGAGALAGPAAAVAEPTLADFQKWNDARKISLLKEHKGKVDALPAAVRAPMQEWIDTRLKAAPKEAAQKLGVSSAWIDAHALPFMMDPNKGTFKRLTRLLERARERAPGFQDATRYGVEPAELTNQVHHYHELVRDARAALSQRVTEMTPAERKAIGLHDYWALHPSTRRRVHKEFPDIYPNSEYMGKLNPDGTPAKHGPGVETMSLFAPEKPPQTVADKPATPAASIPTNTPASTPASTGGSSTSSSGVNPLLVGAGVAGLGAGGYGVYRLAKNDDSSSRK